MAEETPSLHIDTDWKKQAQEEKRKLAEQAAAKPKEPAASGAAVTPGSAPGAGRGAGRERGQLPPASFGTLVQSLLTQTLYYLGDLSTRGGEANLNLDMAKHQMDTLGVLEDKTKNNLSLDDQKLLDSALYETRMRFVSVASQYT